MESFEIGEEVRYQGPLWGCVGKVVRKADDGSSFQVRDAAGNVYRAEAGELSGIECLIHGKSCDRNPKRRHQFKGLPEALKRNG